MEGGRGKGEGVRGKGEGGINHARIVVEVKYDLAN